MEPSTTRSSATSWYGRFTVPEGTAGLWRVGPFTLWAQHSVNHWLLASLCAEATGDGVSIELPSPLAEPPEGATTRHFAFQKTPQFLSLLPALADRPIIVTFDPPLLLPPGERIDLVVSTPLWLEVKAGEPPQLLLEQAMQRPSDTWFGPSTMKGELCYAFPSNAHLVLQDSPTPPHHGLTPVSIRNADDEVLEVEKLKVPAEQLSLYAGIDGKLWTESLGIEREVGAPATLKLGKGPPTQAAGAATVREPRITGSRLSLLSLGNRLRLGL